LGRKQILTVLSYRLPEGMEEVTKKNLVKMCEKLVWVGNRYVQNTVYISVARPACSVSSNRTCDILNLHVAGVAVRHVSLTADIRALQAVIPPDSKQFLKAPRLKQGNPSLSLNINISPLRQCLNSSTGVL
jgi:hypothetical protein